MKARIFLLCLPFFLAYTLLIALSQNHIFFWDGVMQASRWAHWYYENNFAFLFLPPELDAGHPPGLAMLLALAWKLFGKSLVVSHWLMWPFVMGIIWQLARLVIYFFSKEWRSWAMLLVLSDATILAQCSQVSVDVVMVFFSLLAINGILRKRSWQLVAGTCFLAMCSLRGLFSIAALFVFQMSYNYLYLKSLRLKSALFFVPAGIILLLWYGAHFLETGWLFQTPNPGWSAHRTFASPAGILKNIAVLGWRMLDFGRLGEWLVLLWMGWYYFKNKIAIDANIKLMLTWLFAFLLCYFPALILSNNPIGHRYLIPAYLMVALLTLYLLHQSNLQLFTKRVLVIMMIAFHLSGHFWIYPKGVAQGWDASLAHWPYYQIRDEAMQFIQDQEIPLAQIGTAFPNIGPLKFLDLSENEKGLVEMNLDRNKYFLYASVFRNDISEKQWKALEANWIRSKIWSEGQVQVILFAKR